MPKIILFLKNFISKIKFFYFKRNFYFKNLIFHELHLYTSLNEDPQIIFKRKLRKGFYLFKFKLNFHSHSDTESAIYIKDRKVDFNEIRKIIVQSIPNKNYIIPIKLNKSSYIRFDPTNHKEENIYINFFIKAVSKAKFFEFSEISHCSKFTKREKLKNKLFSKSFKSKTKNKAIYKNYLNIKETHLEKIYKDDINSLLSNNNLPLISIIMPTYNTNHNYLTECIDSVISQSYPNWELCIADDFSTDEEVRSIIKRFKEKDKRIKYHFRESNGHISLTSNDAIKLATGDYIALLDHDDLLHKHALFFVTKAILENNNPNLIYSDEDKYFESEGRNYPHFKPDFNEDLFYSYNYISHLGVYKKSVVDEIGGFRVGFEGSQDYDLALRVISHSKKNKIIHIPIVLYHWRVHSGSTAASGGQKSYTTDRSLKLLEEYFSNNFDLNYGSPKVSIVKENRFRVIWPLPEQEPSIELIIPTKDKVEVLSVAVKSILEKTNYQNFKITIVDNQSCEAETFQFFDEYQSRFGNKIKVIKYDKEFNYSAINNFAVDKSDAEIIGLINNDIEVINSDWLREMVSHAYREDVGCVGAKLYFGNDTIQHAGVITGIGGVAGHSHKYYDRNSSGYFDRLQCCQQLSAVTAACLLVKRELFEEVGGLNEANLKVAFNDVDFCLKIDKAGYRNIFTPYAELYHYESISRGRDDDSPEKIERFGNEVKFMIEKWSDEIDSKRVKLCRFYNPNLDKNKEDFSIDMNIDYLDK